MTKKIVPGIRQTMPSSLPLGAECPLVTRGRFSQPVMAVLCHGHPRTKTVVAEGVDPRSKSAGAYDDRRRIAVAAPSRPPQRGGAPHGWMTTTESELFGLPSITLSDQIR